MSNKVHLILTEDCGKTFRYPFAKNHLAFFAGIMIIASCMLFYFSYTGIDYKIDNTTKTVKISELQITLSSIETKLQKTKSEKQHNEEDLINQIAALEEINKKQASDFAEEREALMATAVSELREKSEAIRSVMGGLGVKLPKPKAGQFVANSGGPFIASQNEAHDNLLLEADSYLKSIKKLPLGPPTHGRITSYFGNRSDPLNGKAARHSGIDFGARRGSKIYATGAGIVEKAYYNKSYGNYVIVNHGNGYTSAFAHMQKMFVKKGQKVKRGTLVGLVGNTGRSTGPHLHFEIRRYNTAINPLKFLTVKLPKRKVLKPRKKKVLHVQ
ncbi:MAG: M23 family metallopeptidase [Desulfotalea sp.]